MLSVHSSFNQLFTIIKLNLKVRVWTQITTINLYDLTQDYNSYFVRFSTEFSTLKLNIYKHTYAVWDKFSWRALLSLREKNSKVYLQKAYQFRCYIFQNPINPNVTSFKILSIQMLCISKSYQFRCYVFQNPINPDVMYSKILSKCNIFQNPINPDIFQEKNLKTL